MSELEFSRFVDTKDAARFCGSSKSTLNRLRTIGGGPTYIRIGRRVVYDRRELERWLGDRRFGSTSEYSQQRP
jgi:predicted DNA-binding transcriptional regulator AlpA